MISLARPYNGKILALWDNGHVSSQLLFWTFFKGTEPNSKCSGAQMCCETSSFSSGIFRTCRDRTNPLLTERRNSFSTKDSVPLGVHLLTAPRTECQLSSIILHSVHLVIYISCPVWVDVDFATPDLRPSSTTSGIQILWDFVK